MAQESQNEGQAAGSGSWLFTLLPVAVFFLSFLSAFFRVGAGGEPRRPTLPPPPFTMSWRKGIPVDQTDGSGNPPLHQAILTGDVKSFEEILAGRPDLTATDRHRRTALLAALEEGRLEMAAALFRDPQALRSQVNHLSRAGRTPLMAAFQSGNASISLHLLELGANPKVVTKSGQTMLHFAAAGGNPLLVEHLLKNGFEVNVEHTGGWTPLHYAAQEGHAEAVSYLLARGADFKARLRYGWTPADLARSRGHLEIVKLLEQRVER